jgi:hypothetical protein
VQSLLLSLALVVIAVAPGCSSGKRADCTAVDRTLGLGEGNEALYGRAKNAAEATAAADAIDRKVAAYRSAKPAFENADVSAAADPFVTELEAHSKLWREAAKPAPTSAPVASAPSTAAPGAAASASADPRKAALDAAAQAAVDGMLGPRVHNQSAIFAHEQKLEPLRQKYLDVCLEHTDLD